MGKPYSEKQKNEWKEKVLNQEASGLSIKRWCRENGESAYIFHYWKSKLFQKELTQDSFIEIKNNEPLKRSEESGVQIEYEGFLLHLEKDFDSFSLVRCLKAVKGAVC